MFSNLLPYSILFIIPLLTGIVFLLSRFAAGPFWLNCDPSYLYLFNALHMVKGLTPTFLDNPGTPLQILILWIIRLLNIGHNSSQTIHEVLLHPEFYLYTTYLVLILFFTIASIYLAVYVYRQSQDKIAAILTQLPFLSFFFLRGFETQLPVIPVITNIGAECVLVVISCLYNLYFLKLYFADTPKKRLSAILSLGLVCGLGFATKLTFLPLVLCGLLITPWKTKILFLAGFITAFVLGTFPVIHQYPVLLQSIKDYSVHTGHYGSGPLGFINWSEFFPNILEISSHYWFFVLLSIGLFIWSSKQLIKNHKDRLTLFLWTACLGTLLQYAATAKHFSLHYLLPGLSLFSSIFLLFYLKTIHHSPRYKPTAIIFIIAFTSFCMLQHILYLPKVAALSQDIIKLQNDVSLKYPHSNIIPTSSIATNIYLNQKHALLFGNYAGLHYENNELSSLYPQDVYFDTEHSETRAREDGYGIRDAFGKRIFADDLLPLHQPIIFIKLGTDFPDSALHVQLIQRSFYASAYLLIGSTEKEADAYFLAADNDLKQGKYPEAFALALRSKDLNFEPKEKIEYYLQFLYNHLQHNQ
ncbi:MAG: hypothetical protein HQL15_02415 [Candidatus Omnitrophica bacterium]|nr:hypothetical protein [Candidatus Omnitrophota bacterium]